MSTERDAAEYARRDAENASGMGPAAEGSTVDLERVGRTDVGLKTDEVAEECPIEPFGDRLVAVREEGAAETDSGIIIPDMAQESEAFGVVYAIGPDVPKDLKIGTKVLFSEFAGTPIELNGKEWIVLRVGDIVGKLK